MPGLFVFNKPPGLSSAAFLNSLKKHFGKEPIGHGGTLDPFAEGVLVVGVGRRYTRMLSAVLKEHDKEYRAVILLGADSDTYDKTGVITPRPVARWPENEEIERVVTEIAQRTTQVPPSYSAIKIEGVPAYVHARRGKDVELKERPVKIHRTKVTSIKHRADDMAIEIELGVSPGFYVRSFAHEVGDMLKTGAYLERLIRTKVGRFTLEEALEYKDLDGVVELYFRASGAVQDVGYRYFTLKIAQNWAITGFVRNISPSSVEVVGQAKMAVLERFLDVLGKGSESAQIANSFSYFRKAADTYRDFTAE